jgi:hypothetical protein
LDIVERDGALPFVATRRLQLPATHKRPARDTEVSLRAGKVEVRRPNNPGVKGLAKTVTLNLVEVVELNPPAGVEPVHWRLLTTHEVTDVAAAWRIVDWYRRRWVIEQMFRLMKTHGLRYYLGTGTYSARPDVREVTLIEAEVLDAIALGSPRFQASRQASRPRITEAT